MMRRVTKHTAKTLKSLHQNCFKFPNESRNALKSLSPFNRLFCSTVSVSGFDKPGSESLFVIERSPCQRNVSYHSIDQKGVMKPILLQSADWPKQDSYTLRASNSCNGMVLILNGYTFFLCNPTTGYSVKVLTLDSSFTGDYYNQDIDFGLYYDESVSDYKAVVHFNHTTHCNVYKHVRVMEASLKEKMWIKSDSDYNYWHYYYKVAQFDGVAVKNKIHWLVSNKTGRFWHREAKNQLCIEYPRMIMQFNLAASYTPGLEFPIPKSDEVIGTEDPYILFPVPPPKPEIEIKILGIGVLDGCLWVACRVDKNDQRGDVEVLKMKEYRVKESWTSMFVLPNVEVSDTLTPLLITQNSDFLYSLHGKIMAYNLKTEITSTYYESQGEIQVVPFVENLVSPEGYSWDQDVHEIFENFFWNWHRQKLISEDWRHNRLARRINTLNDRYF